MCVFVCVCRDVKVSIAILEYVAAKGVCVCVFVCVCVCVCVFVCVCVNCVRENSQGKSAL